jgi:hypothetical protein
MFLPITTFQELLKDGLRKIRRKRKLRDHTWETMVHTRERTRSQHRKLAGRLMGSDVH